MTIPGLGLVAALLSWGAQVHAAREAEWAVLEARLADARATLQRSPRGALHCEREALSALAHARVGGLTHATWIPAGFEGLRDDLLLPSLATSQGLTRAHADEGVLATLADVVTGRSFERWLDAAGDQALFGLSRRDTDLFVLAVPRVGRQGTWLVGSMRLEVFRYLDGAPLCTGSAPVEVELGASPQSSAHELDRLLQHLLAEAAR